MLLGKKKEVDGQFAKIYLPKLKERKTNRRDNGRKNVERKIVLTKRRKFVVVSLVLAVAMYIVQKVSLENRYIAIAILGVSSYLLSAWSVYRDLRGVQWITNLIMPSVYPMAIALFYFLLPNEMWVSMGVNLFFAVTMYSLLLATNIYAVASIRTIQLLRAARAVGFLLSVLTCALLYQVIFALRLPVLAGVSLIFASSFLIFYQGVWTHSLSIKGEKRELIYTLIGSVILSEGALAMSFWLIDVALASIMLSMMMYVLLGFFQQDLEKRLFQRTIQEYGGFAIIVFLVIVSTVFWRWMN